MTHTTWHATIEHDGPALTDPQLDQVAQLAATAEYVHHDTHRHITKVHLRLTATDAADAATRAVAALDHLPAYRALRADGLLRPPRALTVQSDAAHAEGLHLLTTAEVAARLGVDPARIRQLSTDDPAFPPPVLSLQRGRLYDAAAIDTYARTDWNRAHGPRTRHTP